MELLRSHQCSLASPEGCQRAVCVKVDLAHHVCWHSSLCRVTVPDPQPGKEFVFIRGHQCCLEVTEYWGAEHAEGGSLKPSWNVEAGTSCCCQWYSWKADVFNITAQQSILKVESPKYKKGSLIPLLSHENRSKRLQEAGMTTQAGECPASSLVKVWHHLLQGRPAGPLLSVCLQISCPFRERSNKSRLEEMQRKGSISPRLEVFDILGKVYYPAY